MKVTRKFTIEEARKMFRDGGCILLEDVYVNNTTPMQYICECGEVSFNSLNNMKRGRRCQKCKGKRLREERRKPLKEVREIFEKNGCVLLEEEYINGHSLMKYICECGNIAEISLMDLQRGSRCRRCKGEKIRKKKQLPLKDVIKIFEAAGCVLLETEYINNTIPLKFICKCGDEAEKPLQYFQNSSRCNKCGKEKNGESRRKYTYEQVEKYVSEKGFKLLSKEYKTTHDILWFKCPEGHEYKTSFKDFYAGRGCQKCFSENNKGENHPNWNPNLTEEDREKGRNYEEYRDWIKEVYKRDNYTCQCCGSNKKLNAHHILNYGEHRELRIELSNGITLCEKCHIDFHNTYTRRNNTREQLEEYIKLNKKGA